MGEAALPPVLQLGDLEAEDEAAAHDSQKWLFPCGASAEEALVCSALAQHVCVSQPLSHGHSRATLAQFLDGIRPGAGAELQAALDAPAPADSRPRSLRARARRPSGNSMPAEAPSRGHHQSGRMYEILLCAVLGVCQRITRRRSDAPPELPMDPSDGTLACGAEGGAANWLLDEFARSFGVSRAERGTALLLVCLATCRRISLADDVPSAALLSLTCVALSAAAHHGERARLAGQEPHRPPQARSARWRPAAKASDAPTSADAWCRDALRAAGAQLREYVVSQLPLAIGGCDGGDDDSAAHASLRSLLQLLASTCQLDGGASGAHRAVQDDLLVAALQRAARIELEQETHAAEQTVRFAHQSSTGSGESF